MRTPIALGLFAMMACSALFACNDADVPKPPPQPEESSFDVTTNGDGQVLTTISVRDKVTGCEYLVVRTGSGIAITPRASGVGVQMCQ